MSRATTRIRRAARYLGTPGVIGFALLVFCTAFFFSALVPAQHQLDRLREDYSALHQRYVQSLSIGEQAEETPADKVARFFGRFPRARTAPDWIARIQDAARRENLTLEQGEYRPVRERAGELTRYQIVLPVHGDYVHVRRFLASVLRDVPYAALDGVSFERKKVSDATIEARVRLSLFMEQEQ